MKADEDVRMCAAEAPVLFAKAIEMFLVERTCHHAIAVACHRLQHFLPDPSFTVSMRAWQRSSSDPASKKVLTRADIQAAIADHPPFDFLQEIIGRPGEAPTQPSIYET